MKRKSNHIENAERIFNKYVSKIFMLEYYYRRGTKLFFRDENGVIIIKLEQLDDVKRFKRGEKYNQNILLSDQILYQIIPHRINK